MQVLYKAELAWTAKALTDTAERLERTGDTDGTPDIGRAACLLRAEQLRSIAKRLASAVENGDKRIAIR